MKSIYYNGCIIENYEEPYILQAYVGAYEDYLKSFNSIAVLGPHNWKNGQELVENVDYKKKEEVVYYYMFGGYDTVTVCIPITSKEDKKH